MKINKYIVVYFVIALLVSCGKESNKNTEFTTPEKNSIKNNIELKVVNIDMETKHTLPFDSLIEFVSFVKLETTTENLIGDVFNIMFVNDQIVISDPEISKSITAYDMNGRFLNKIGRVGQGPEEYTSLWYVSTTPDQSGVVVSDAGTQKIRTFDVDGKFMELYSPPFWFNEFEFIDENNMLMYNRSGIRTSSKDKSKEYTARPQLVICNKKGEIQYKAFPSEYSRLFNYTTGTPLMRFGDKVMFNPSFSDTIYNVDARGFSPYYYLDIKRNVAFEASDMESNNTFEEKRNAMPVYFNGGLVELNDYAVFRMFERNINWSRFVIYSKKNNQSYYCNGTYYDTRLRFCTNNKFLYKDNMIVVSVNAETLLMFKDELYRLCKKEDIDSLLKNLTEDDNPVLMFYRVKI